MPSLANRWRIACEHLLRAVSVALLGWMLFLSLRTVRSGEPTFRTGSPRTVRDSLPAWTVSAAGTIHLEIDTVPDRETREWLVALRRNGTTVGWSGAGIPGTALAISPVASPAIGVGIRVAAPAGSRVEISDALGVVDTVTASGGGVSLRTKGVALPVVALVSGQVARASEMDSLLPKRVAVIGRAGWESKFVTAALEESGWSVDARLSVAPGIDVNQGDIRTFDTARYAAVVVLDSSAARFGNGIATFVRQGGGVILAGNGARVAALNPIAAGKPGMRVRPRTISFTRDSPRRALAFEPIPNLRTDAVVIEVQDGRVAIAARREGSGRVVQVGYDETWRWRLMGEGEAAEAHREWWSDIVAGAAYRAERKIGADGRFWVGGPPPMKQSTATQASLQHQSDAAGITSMPSHLRSDPAPLAHLINDLGPSRSPPAASFFPTCPLSLVPCPFTTLLPAWMLFTLLVTLLAEWASRRLRGAP